MEAVRFVVDDTFDLRSRNVFIAAGRVLAGVIGPGTVLHREGTGQEVHVLGVELLCRPGPPVPTDRCSLRIDRADAAAVDAGAVLVTPARSGGATP